MVRTTLHLIKKRVEQKESKNQHKKENYQQRKREKEERNQMKKKRKEEMYGQKELKKESGTTPEKDWENSTDDIITITPSIDDEKESTNAQYDETERDITTCLKAQTI